MKPYVNYKGNHIFVSVDDQQLLFLFTINIMEGSIINGSPSNVTNMLKGLKKFDGTKPSDFRAWAECSSMVISVNRPDIGLLFDGKTRPTEDARASDDDDNSNHNDEARLTSVTARWDRANRDLFVALFLLTSGPAQLMVRKRKDGLVGIRGDGISAWNDLMAKYINKSKEARRALLQQLQETKMLPGQDPDEYFLAAELIRAELDDMGEPVSDATYEDILVQGFTSDYDGVKLSIYRDPTYTLDQIQLTMRNFYIDNLSRKATSNITGRGTAMAMEQTCHHCRKPGHYKSDCPDKDKPFSNKKKKWCSFHNSKTHNDEDCRCQNSSTTTAGSNTVAFAVATDSSTVASSSTSIGEPMDNNDSTPFDGGFLFSTAPSTTVATPYSGSITMLVDSGASENYLDSDMIPGLANMLWNYKVLVAPKEIVTAGNHTLLGTHTGTLQGTVTDDSAHRHRVKLPCVLVPGLGRHIFSTMDASRRGVVTTIEAGRHRLIKGNTTLPLQQLSGDLGLCSIVVNVQQHTATQPQGIVMAALPTADIWHRRLGHMNPRSMDLLRKENDNGVDYAGDTAACSVCALGKSKQKAHPKTSHYGITAPMQLVYTDLMGPISPPAIGGFQYVSKFTDHHSRWHEVYLIKHKSDATASLKLYNTTVSVSAGRRIERLRSDKGGEYIGKSFKQACNNAAIVQEFTSTNTPQQNGVSERDGGTLAGIARCFMIEGNFPKFMWGELLFTAAYIANRSPHSSLGGQTPYFKLHNKHADLSFLRAIGSRSFVHTEVYTSKFEDKAWEGMLCGYSTNSKAYRVYNPSTRRVVESRNVTFIETPPRNDTTGDQDTEFYDYLRDVLNFTTTFDDRSFDIDHAEAAARIKNMINYDSQFQTTPRTVVSPPAPSGVVSASSSISALPSTLQPGVVSASSSAVQPGVVSASSTTIAPSSSLQPTVVSSVPRVTRASTRNSPTIEPTADDADLNAVQLRTLRGLGNFMLPKVDFGHDSEYPTSLVFACVAGRPTSSGNSGGDGHRIKIPDTYGQAKSSPQAPLWEAAIDKEMNSLNEHKVFDLVSITEIPKGEKAIGSRYVFKQKADGTFKARLVVQGFSQRPGIDFGQSFAPVCRIGSQRMVLAIACEHDWPVYQLDVQVAFLQSKIDGNVYVKTAPGRDSYDKNGAQMVMKLKRSLYGLSQSPALWYGTIDASLLEIGFIPTKSDPCVYTHGHVKDNDFAILTLYVDDILLTGMNVAVLKQLKGALMTKYAMTDMGEAGIVLGMTVTRDLGQGTLTISQASYVSSILERYGMSTCNPVSTPGTGSELSTNYGEADLLDEAGVKLYQTIVGSVQYLAQVTRYDISYTVNQLSRACSKPAILHMTAAKRLLRYLKGAPDLAITYRKGNFGLTGYTDASFAANPDSRKSTTGYLFMFCGAPVSFGAVTQTLVAQSTVEAELIAASYGCKEAVYLSNFMTELCFGKQFATIAIKCDSQGALHVMGNRTYSSRTKHIALRFFYVRELIRDGHITIHHVSSTNMLADVCTKWLAAPAFKAILLLIEKFKL